ncbi:ABC transporter ATP-binding protein [soil metagenome]
MEPALTLTDLHRHYGDVRAVDGVTLRVQAGERFVLLGPSGSGKTTILRLVAGFDAPTSGSVVLDGQSVDGLPPERRNVGVVFQDYALFPHRTVAQNIEFGLRMRKVDKAVRRQRVAELLDLVGLTREAGRTPNQLSGGQQQRVALARALAPSPALLLLDEPLANLDRRLRESLRHELLRITDAVDITSVLVTHDQEEALSFADRIAVLRDGQVAQIGTPAEVWRAPADTFVATFLGDMNLLPVQAIAGGEVQVSGIDGVLQVEGGATSNGAASNRQSSRAVVACLRPEALTAVADPAGAGTVRSMFYAGGSATMTVDVDGTPITVRAQQPDGRPIATIGDTVRIQPVVSHVRLLDDPGIRA